MSRIGKSLSSVILSGCALCSLPQAFVTNADAASSCPSPSTAIPNIYENNHLPNGSAFAVQICGPVLTSGPVIELEDYERSVYPRGASHSDYDLLNKLMTYAAQVKASKIILPAGRVFSISAPSAARGGVYIKDLKDVVIDGQGSTFVFQSFNLGLFVASSDRIQIKNLNIDWGPLLAFPARIVQSKDSKGQALTYAKVEPGYAINDQSPPDIRVVADYDIAQREWARKTPIIPDYSASTAYRSDLHGYVLNQYPFVKNIPQGSPVILATRDTSRGHAVYVTNGSNDITFTNVTVYSAPGMGFAFMQAGRGFHLSKCKVARKEGAIPARLISTTADAVHFGQVQGDIIVEDSKFNYQGDDGINIHGNMAVVTSLDRKQFVIEGANGSVQAVNPPMIADPKDPNCSIPSVAFASRPQNRISFVGLTDFIPVSELSPNGAINARVARSCLLPIAGSTSKKAQITFEFDSQVGSAELPSVQSDMKSGLVVAANLSTSGERFIIRRNTFGTNHGKGMLIQTANGLIDTNLVDRPATVGIQFRASLNWLEGPGASSVFTRRNAIYGSNYFTAADSFTGTAAIASEGVTGAAPGYPAALSKNSPNSNLFFELNQIDTVAGQAIRISGATNVSIKDTSLHQVGLIQSKSGKAFNPIVVDGAQKVNVYETVYK